MLENLTVKERWMLAALAAALAWGLIGGVIEIRQSIIRSATPVPNIYRELLEALPDPEFLEVKSSRELPASESDDEVIYMTVPLLPEDRGTEVVDTLPE